MQDESLEVLKARSKKAYQAYTLVIMIGLLFTIFYTMYQSSQRRYEARDFTKSMLAVMDKEAHTDLEHYVSDQVKQCVLRAEFSAFEKAYVGFYSPINSQVYVKELNDVKNQCLVKIGDSAELLNSRGVPSTSADNAYISKMKELLKTSI